MPKPFNAPNHLVAAIVYDGLCTFEFGMVADVFGIDRPEMGPEWYRLITCAADTGPMRATGGLHFTADAGLERIAEAGTIIMPGWKDLTTPPSPELTEALCAAVARGARVVSICSGAFVLAAAGLLKGRTATTHWRYTDAFRTRFPDIQLDPNVLYVDEGQVLTSAGSAAGIDLLLHIIRSDFGSEAANNVARRLVAPAHRDGGQVQFIEQPVPRQANGRLAPLLDLMRERLDQPMTVSWLAQQAAMSERTFLRRFREMTGMTPAGWLVEARISTAKRLLESSALTIEDIALTTGFGTASTLRLHFRHRIGIGPREYRHRFTLNRTGHAVQQPRAA